MRTSPVSTRHHNDVILLPLGPNIPFTDHPSYLLAIQFLLRIDYLRDGRRHRLMLYTRALERAVIRYLIANDPRPAPQTSEEPKPS